MSDKLKSYMVSLATEVSQLSAFIDDPHRAATEWGLDAADSNILLSGDQSKIYLAIAGPPTAPAAAEQSGPHLPHPAVPQLPTVVGVLQYQPTVASSDSSTNGTVGHLNQSGYSTPTTPWGWPIDPRNAFWWHYPWAQG